VWNPKRLVQEEDSFGGADLGVDLRRGCCEHVDFDNAVDEFRGLEWRFVVVGFEVLENAEERKNGARNYGSQHKEDKDLEVNFYWVVQKFSFVFPRENFLSICSKFVFL
jgi:hypothetical protein